MAAIMDVISRGVDRNGWTEDEDERDDASSPSPERLAVVPDLGVTYVRRWTENGYVYRRLVGPKRRALKGELKLVAPPLKR